MIIDAMPNSRMRATASRLAHQRGALQHLQVVAELLRTRKSSAGCQHEYRLVGQSVSWNRRARPRLLGRIFPRVVQVFGMVEEVGSHERDHGRLTATVVAQI